MRRQQQLLSGICMILVFLFLSARQIFAAPPENFQNTPIITSGLTGPSGFEIAPDGRIFILERAGAIKIVKNGQLLSQAFATLPSVASGDRGLIGIAFDPDFENNKFVYFYYTGLDLLNRVVRLTATEDVATDAPVLIYQTESPSFELHVGGSIGFGPDGKLYLAVGDNGYPPNAQNLSNPHGKILRINKNGTVPLDNPFVFQEHALPEIWAYGLRNPWRFQFDKVTGRLYAGDVGDSSWEEINLITPGANYGWPYSEGFCVGCTSIQPIFAYPHNNQSSAVTGGPVYRATQFPAEYQGNLFFGDYAQGFIKRLPLFADGSADQVVDFDLQAGSVVDMKVAPDGSLYYITYYPGRLYQITYSENGNQIPVANATADVTKGVNPLTVHFSSAGSSDPNSDPLEFLWDFGDGTTSTEINPVKTYSDIGSFTVELSVSDGTHTAQAVPLVIQVGLSPTVTIGSPLENAPYNAGDTIFYSASAVDGAGFDLDDSAFTTEILMHHDTHIHPFLGPLSGNKTGQFTIPDTGEHSVNTWFEIKISAVDTHGLSAAKSVFIYPRISSFILDSDTAGLTLLLDGAPTPVPQTIPSVVGFKRELSAPLLQKTNDTWYQLDHWSDNKPLVHFITTEPSPTSYTAFFKEIPPFTGEYFANKNLQGPSVLTRDDPVVNFDWHLDAPDPQLNADSFSVRWHKTQYFNFGSYTFITTVDDGVRLFIDGEAAIDKWQDQGATRYTATRTLSQGDHEIVMEYYESGGNALSQLTWELAPDQPDPNASPAPSSVVSPSPQIPGFTATYFANQNLSGQPSLIRSDPEINFYWNYDSPDPLLPDDHFSVRWTENKIFTDGTYRFSLTADDGIRLYIDTEMILNKWIDQGPTTYTVDKTLSAGTHTVRVEYFENGGGAVAKMSFVQINSPPQSSPSVTPSASGNGYHAQFWNYTDTGISPSIPSVVPEHERIDQEINFDWQHDSPVPGTITADHFMARWSKEQQFAAGNYLFTTTSDDGIRVYFDSNLVIDQWNDHPKTTYSRELPITDGTHTIIVEYYENAGDAVAQFSINTIAQPQGNFTGEYFANLELSGTPALTRNENNIGFDWKNGSPDTTIPPDGFSARWTKTKSYTAGNYTFRLKSDDGVRLFIDNNLVINNWTDHSFTTDTATVPITAGEHTLKIEYYENSGEAIVIFEEL